MLTLSGNMFTLFISLIVHLLKSVEVPWVNVVSALAAEVYTESSQSVLAKKKEHFGVTCCLIKAKYTKAEHLMAKMCSQNNQGEYSFFLSLICVAT